MFQENSLAGIDKKKIIKPNLENVKQKKKNVRSQSKFNLGSAKDLHLNRKGTQITLHLSRAGIDLATYGLREKRLDLSPREVHYFS